MKKNVNSMFTTTICFVGIVILISSGCFAGSTTFKNSAPKITGLTASAATTPLPTPSPTPTPVPGVPAASPTPVPKNVNYRVGNTVVFAVTAMDPDGDPISYEWFSDDTPITTSSPEPTSTASPSSNEDFSTSSGSPTFRWKAVEGIHTITCIVSDDRNSSTVKDIQVTVVK